MNKQRLSLGGIALALGLAILACQFQFSTAQVKNLRLARDKEGNQPTTQFEPQDTFYLVGDLANAPNDTQLKAVWTAVEVEEIAPNSEIRTSEVSGGSGGFWFQLANEPGVLWPNGKYKVDLYLNDELNQSLEFEVKGTVLIQTPTEESPAVPPPGALNQVYTSRDEGGAQATTTFAQADIFYTHFLVAAPSGSAQVRGVLTAVSAEGVTPESIVTEVNEALPNGAQWIRFSNSLPWPKGIYRIDLYADGTLVQSMDIQVASSNHGSAQLSAIFTSLDQAGQQQVETFPNTAKIYVQFTLEAPAGPVEVKGIMVAREVQGIERNTYVTEAAGVLSSGSYWLEYSNNGPWPAGKYLVYLYLDGEFISTVEIQVL